MKRHPLTCATWNIGNGTAKDAARIIEQERPAALALQEASDQGALVDALCGGFGYLAIVGRGEPGQKATPLLYDPAQLTALRHIHALMAPGQKVGRGTGPDRMKPKWLIGGFFIHRESGRHIALASTHRVAGNAHGVREEVAVEHARNVAAYFRQGRAYRSVAVVMGDWNSVAVRRSMDPLRLHGWTADQLVSEIPTHGHWTPDHVWFREHWQNGNRDDRIRYVGHHTIDGTHSDHRPLVVDFELTARPR